MDDKFPPRNNLNDNISQYGVDQDTVGYQNSLLNQLESALESSDPNKWGDEPDIKVIQTKKQKTFVWIRIYLQEENDTFKSGDILNITHVPTNEQIELIFGAYEKLGLNRDHNDEVVEFVTDEDTKILCCMVDVERINKESDDIPTLRTFFKNSRYYQENIYRKTDLEISRDDETYEYSSISF